MSLITNVSSNVTSQYRSSTRHCQQWRRSIHSWPPEVEPAPPVNGVPTPGFASIGNFSMAFYTNIGTAFNNTVSCPGVTPCTGTTAGPAMVVAEELDSHGNPVSTSTPATTCAPSTPCSLQVRLFLPETGVSSPGVPTCPLQYGGTLISTNCTYPCPPDGTGTECQYASNNYRLMANVQDVVNNPNDVDASGVSVEPIFSYTILDPTSAAQTISLTSDEVQSQQMAVPSGYDISTQSLTACSAPSPPDPPSYGIPVAISCRPMPSRA